MSLTIDARRNHFCDFDGFDSNCLAASLLLLLLHNTMIQLPIADINVSKWKREACKVGMTYLCSHNDEHFRPAQRDQHNRVCDVYNYQHKIVDLDHVFHSATLISNFFFLLCFSHYRGIRVKGHSQFDSIVEVATTA